MIIPHTQKIIRIRELRLKNILGEEEGLGGLFFWSKINVYQCVDLGTLMSEGRLVMIDKFR